MKILVLGAGATGGYFGGRLAQAAQAGRTHVSVDFLVRPQRAESLRRDGLTVDSPQGGFTIPVNARVHQELAAEYDLVMLSCKAYDLESAILSIYPGVRPDTLLLPLLNGLAHFDRLDGEFGAHRVLGGCCAIAAQLAPDGRIRQMNEMQRITFGLRPGNAASAAAALDTLAAAYRETPVDVRHADDVLLEIWEKYFMLATLAAMTCLMRGAVCDIVASPEGSAMMRRTLAECEAAAAHAGHRPRPQVRAGVERMLTAPSSTATASMLRDLESGGRTEGMHVVGDMLARARAAGSDATMLAAAWAHLCARDGRLARERAAA